MSRNPFSARGPIARWIRVWREFFAILARFSPYMQGRWRLIGYTVAMTVGFAAMRIFEPWPIKYVIDYVLLGQPLETGPEIFRDPERGREWLLYALAAAILAAAGIRGLFYYRQKLAMAELGISVVAELRLDLYRHVQSLSLDYHDRRRTGDTIVRLTSDIRILRDSFVSLPLELAEAVLLMAGMAVVMLIMDWQLALIALTLVPVLYILVRRYRGPMAQAAKEQRKREGNLATFASEALSAIKVVQGLRQEEAEVKKFGSTNRKSQRTEIKLARYEAKLRWGTEVAVATATSAVVLFASVRVIQGQMSPGDLIILITYLRIFARPMRRMSGVAKRMIRASAAGARVLEVLNTESTVADKPDAVEAPAFRGEIRFENVTLSYRGGPPVLSDVSFTVNPGETVAVVGPTGSGKSSLLSLIPRFYDPTSGCVTVDGGDVRDFTLSSLRRQVSFVFQEPVLFAASLAENIAYGKAGATQEEIEAAARRAGIEGVIANLPDGYDTILGERGATLSGGQRQCVTIARAIIRDTPIVLMDEITTGLDAESANLVLGALESLTAGRTVLVISHDLESVRNADRILVLQNGRQVEADTYDALIEQRGLFHDLQKRRAI